MALSNRCQRMKPHASQEYAKASRPPSSAWRSEWPSRSTHVVWPHMGHLRCGSTTTLPTAAILGAFPTFVLSSDAEHRADVPADGLTMVDR